MNNVPQGRRVQAQGGKYTGPEVEKSGGMAKRPMCLEYNELQRQQGPL